MLLLKFLLSWSFKILCTNTEIKTWTVFGIFSVILNWTKKYESIYFAHHINMINLPDMSYIFGLPYSNVGSKKLRPRT